uniref:DUF4408 domain-containing protein n=1 Tax=Kalanchoe fedtschenkoi TaxID=63787 RepID=A0A7N0ZXX9_KALFE
MEARHLKRMMQLLFSISLVSFLISMSSWVCYGFQTVRFCVTTLPVQLITHSINRNCIFLICNGLLVFIAKTSKRSCSTFHTNDEHKTTTTTTKHAETENDGEEEERVEKRITCPARESGNPVVDKEVVMVHKDDSSFKRWFFDQVKMEKAETIESDDGEGSEDIKELSMEEVNKRFDEFIRKMKEEIRLEASQLELAMYSQV